MKKRRKVKDTKGCKLDSGIAIKSTAYEKFMYLVNVNFVDNLTIKLDYRGSILSTIEVN